MKRIFLLTGSNIEHRLTHLEKAKTEICDRIGKFNNESSVYESEPWGFKSDSAFLNQVIDITTNKTPGEVLKIILSIENEMGRIRMGKTYSSRVIDIDILYFDDDIVKQKNLEIPHPRLHLRKFTLEPLFEIAPDFTHPLLKESNKVLLQACNDSVKVWKYDRLAE